MMKKTLTVWISLSIVCLVTASERSPRESGFTEQERNHWAFQPIQTQSPPEVADRSWCRTNIDRFIYHRLQSEGLRPAEEAEKATLIRRATLDLTGLPPTRAQIDAFVNDAAEDAYERLIDRLLESEQYGVRWARHWLDWVRYAESDGYKADHFRPNAWRYRDYVVASFNADKPYDRFVLEQLAGDEVAPNDPNALVATGFLRLGIYEYNQRDARTQWNVLLNELTDVTGDVFLGMSMSCARCHDHKFDPVRQKDYYRLQAFFTPIRMRDDIPIASPQQRLQHEEQNAHW